MKRVFSTVCILLLLITFTSFTAQPARAADWEYTFYGTVGQTEYFIITSNAYDEIQEAKIYNGVIPGMELDISGGVTLGLVGVPTTDGEFKVFITLKTRDLGTVDIKVTVYINPASSSEGTPVVTKDPTGETVVEGESATFIAKATNVRQYCWQIAIADACIDAVDLPSYIGKGIKVSGWNTEKLVLENIPTELNGAYIWCQFVGAEESVTSNAAMLTVIAEKDATPIITKHPTDETVEEGGEAIFVAKAKYAQHYIWQLVSPDGIVFDCDTVHKSFPDLKVDGAKTERITLSNIPIALDGYRIRCMFTAGDTVVSDMAKLTVTAKPTEAPTESPTEPSTEPPTEAVTEPTKGNVTDSDKNTSKKNNSNKFDKTEQSQPSKQENTGGNTALLITAIIAGAAVAIAGIMAFVILKLKGSGRK